jgi:hypothetical protein
VPFASRSAIRRSGSWSRCGSLRPAKAAAIAAASRALDQSVSFEPVEHRHQDAVVACHGLAKLTLADRSALREQVEDEELPGLRSCAVSVARSRRVASWPSSASMKPVLEPASLNPMIFSTTIDLIDHPRRTKES